MDHDKAYVYELLCTCDGKGQTAKRVMVDALFADIEENAKLREDKARLDWLDSKVEQGVNTLGHKGPEKRGHVYTNQCWVPHATAEGARVAHWDHFWGPSVRAAIDAARK